MRQAFLILSFLLSVALNLTPLSASVVAKSVSGRVLEVDLEGQKVSIAYFHPATGEKQELFFTVGEKTGFAGIPGLADLKTGDPVTIDYEKNSSGDIQVLRIALVPLADIPEELKNFKGL